VEAANSAGGRDNITVVLVQNNKERTVQEPTTPAPRRSEVPPTSAKAVAPTSVTAVASDRKEVPRAQAVSSSSKRGTSPVVWLLLVACLLLAGALAWALTRKPARVSEGKLAAVSTPAGASQGKTERTPGEQWLRDGISANTSAFMLDTTTARTPIILTDSIYFQKETLHVNGAGVVLRGDSKMTVPAFVFSDSVRFVFLENMDFENFPIAIQARDGVLQLQNVRFRNCRTSVAFNLRPTDGVPVSGYANGARMYAADSSSINVAKRP
jgi:hypothetical protein